MYKEAVEMYNEAGMWEKAHNIASKYLDSEEVSDMYVKRAEELEEAGKYREAEKLYLSVNAPDLAIAMYKKVEQYDNMVRDFKYHEYYFNKRTFLGQIGREISSESSSNYPSPSWSATGKPRKVQSCRNSLPRSERMESGNEYVQNAQHVGGGL